MAKHWPSISHRLCQFSKPLQNEDMDTEENGLQYIPGLGQPEVRVFFVLLLVASLLLVLDIRHLEPFGVHVKVRNDL